MTLRFIIAIPTLALGDLLRVGSEIAHTTGLRIAGSTTLSRRSS